MGRQSFSSSDRAAGDPAQRDQPACPHCSLVVCWLPQVDRRGARSDRKGRKVKGEHEEEEGRGHLRRAREQGLQEAGLRPVLPDAA